ncbi:MAG: hypothetical protein MR290_02895 [Ruminococcus sp.]|nr:hypothetical protein [Ruminococcus sp.]
MPQAKAGGRETEKSLPQSNAAHLTAPSRRGRKQRAIRESPLQTPICHPDLSTSFDFKQRSFEHAFTGYFLTVEKQIF